MTICHHAARHPLALDDLVLDGSKGSGPARLGLWTKAEPAGWMRSYGPHLHRIAIRDDARILATRSADLCFIAGANTDAAWTSLGVELRARYDVVVMRADDPADTEIVVLDPSAIASLNPVDWPA